jgi:uncharacterized protein (TIGR02145 family)
VAYPSTWNVTTSATLATTATRPSTYWSPNFIIWSSSYRFDWVKTQNNNLWWDTTNTLAARQWPCANGYHVPTTLEWDWLLQAWCKYRGWTACVIPVWSSRNWDDLWWEATFENFRLDLKLPRAGRRGRDDGSLYDQGTGGRYWSSSLNGDNAHSLYFSSSVVYPQLNYLRADGFSVRCFRN